VGAQLQRQQGQRQQQARRQKAFHRRTKPPRSAGGGQARPAPRGPAPQGAPWRRTSPSGASRIGTPHAPGGRRARAPTQPPSASRRCASPQ
jgi:hypothetical protein